MKVFGSDESVTTNIYEKRLNSEVKSENEVKFILLSISEICISYFLIGFIWRVLDIYKQT